MISTVNDKERILKNLWKRLVTYTSLLVVFGYFDYVFAKELINGFAWPVVILLFGFVVVTFGVLFGVVRIIVIMSDVRNSEKPPI
jgi:hypothetical protein